MSAKLDPRKIIVHHSLTKDSESVSWGAIRRYHTQVNGWSDIGYHWGIERIGDCYEILVGRPMTRIGAHTKGQNADSIGICLVGNYDMIIPPTEATDKLFYLITWLQTLFGISIDNVKFHRDYANYKTCPGSQFDYNKFIRDLKSYQISEWS